MNKNNNNNNIFFYFFRFLGINNLRDARTVIFSGFKFVIDLFLLYYIIKLVYLGEFYNLFNFFESYFYGFIFFKILKYLFVKNRNLKYFIIFIFILVILYLDFIFILSVLNLIFNLDFFNYNYYLLNNEIIDNNNSEDLNKFYMDDNNNNKDNVDCGNDKGKSDEDGKFNFKIDKSLVNKAIDSGLSKVGLTAAATKVALEVGKSVPGNPLVKIGAGAALGTATYIGGMGVHKMGDNLYNKTDLSKVNVTVGSSSSSDGNNVNVNISEKSSENINNSGSANSNKDLIDFIQDDKYLNDNLVENLNEKLSDISNVSLDFNEKLYVLSTNDVSSSLELIVDGMLEVIIAICLFSWIIFMINSNRFLLDKFINSKIFRNIKNIKILNIINYYKNNILIYNYKFLNIIKKFNWMFIFIFSLSIFSTSIYLYLNVMNFVLDYLLTYVWLDSVEKINIEYINIEVFSSLENILRFLFYLNSFSILILVFSIYLYFISLKNDKYNSYYNIVAIFLIMLVIINGYYLYDIKLNISNYMLEFSDKHIYIKNLVLILSKKSFNKNIFKGINVRLLSNINSNDNNISINKKLDDVYNEWHDGIDLNYIITKYGSYNNYLENINKINIVNEDFIKLNYPEYINNENFILFLKDLNPLFRDDKELVTNLYQSILKTNDGLNLILNNKDILKLDKSSLDYLLKYSISLRNDFINKNKKLFSSNAKYLSNFLISINKKLLIKSFNNFVSENNNIKNIDKFNDTNLKIKNIFIEDIFLAQNITTEVDKQNFIFNEELEKYYSQIKQLLITIFIYLEMLDSLDTKFLGLNSWIDNLINDSIKLRKNNRIETYKTKKKEKKKAMRAGLIYKDYEQLLNFKIEELNKEILENLTNDNLLNKNLEIMDLINDKVHKLEIIKANINDDLNNLYSEFKKLLNISDILVKFMFSNNKEELKRIEKLNNYIYDQFLNRDYDHDSLIEILKYYNHFDRRKFVEGFTNKTIIKRTAFAAESIVFQNLFDIINNDKIFNSNKQFLIEKYILEYEQEFIWFLFQNISNEDTKFKFLNRILKNISVLEKKIEVLYNNFNIRNYEEYYKKKDNINNRYYTLILALFIVVDFKILTNYILSRILTIISVSSTISQNQLLVDFSDNLIKFLKYKINKMNIDDFEDFQIKVINEAKVLLSDNNLTIENKNSFGITFIHLISDTFDNILVKYKKVEDGQSFILYSITEDYQMYLAKNFYNPIRLPMICPPKEWKISSENKITQVGGYLVEEFNDFSDNLNVIRHNNYNKEKSEISSYQIDTINYLNKQEFIINADMLDFILEEWNKEESIIFNNYNKIHPLTDKLSTLKNNDKNKVSSHNSKYWNNVNIINLAVLFKNNKFYFPTFLDFRGRIYPLPTYFTYQSNDLARSLIGFSSIYDNKNNDKLNNTISAINNNYDTTKNLELEDIDYVKIYMANCFGKNKLLLKNRILWVNKNWDDMVSLYNTNKKKFLENYVYLSKEPFQFMASFLGLYHFIFYKKEIKIPILFDATCSGIQHLSALSKNIEIGKLVNLINNKDMSPNDFYMYAINKIIESIDNLPNSNKLKHKLKLLNFSRKWLKQSIMTIPYNSKEFGILKKLAEEFIDNYYINKETLYKLDNNIFSLQEVIEISKKNQKIKKKDKNIIKEKLKVENQKELELELDKKEISEDKGTYIYIPSNNILKENNNKSIYFTHKELYMLANIIRSTVISIIPSFEKINKFFDQIIKILKIYNIPIFWITPSHMKVFMSARKMTSKKIKTNLVKNKNQVVSLLIPTDQMDYKAMYNGLMPNLIHSLDASNIHLLTKNINKYYIDQNNINLYTIHDCFATDYKNMHILEILVRLSFIELYFNEDYLLKLYNLFVSQIESCTNVLTETIYINNEKKDIKYIEIEIKTKTRSKFKRIDLPELPLFEWNINENELKAKILKSIYLIS